ncbi:uncharacterized protein BT62DRAFT_687289 [Guyanagaster necrorhizus]|uniref:Uncharacterized protein n=1 Tax=Guyanagaster necrorhizus TaxID=856835 RepID=A0A9P7VFY3_9AGAR|nr:uncharacterized protein BT62DRAFT_687289 [Guyanagaster necrorhizus MCA 3950]KAG7439857.1 hypothetical protein BT62DRAFT_687289 [Guyanagaster necrorhizus MCA 3950]
MVHAASSSHVLFHSNPVPTSHSSVNSSIFLSSSPSSHILGYGGCPGIPNLATHLSPFAYCRMTLPISGTSAGVVSAYRMSQFRCYWFLPIRSQIASCLRPPSVVSIWDSLEPTRYKSSYAEARTSHLPLGEPLVKSVKLLERISRYIRDTYDHREVVKVVVHTN